MQIYKIDVSPLNLKKFGRLMFACLTFIGFIAYFKHKPGFKVFWILGGLFLATGEIVPGLLFPIYRIWIVISLALGWINTRLALFIVYYFVLTPIGLLARACGKDFLNERWRKDAPSYWIAKPKPESAKDSYERTF